MTENLKSRLLAVDHGDGGSQWARNPDGHEAWAVIAARDDHIEFATKQVQDLRAQLAAKDAEIDRLEKSCADWAEVSQRNYQRAKKAEADVARLREALQSAATHIENDAESTAVAFGVSDWTRVAPQSAKIVDQARAALKGGDDG